MPRVRTATYTIAVDWANDGTFVGTYDNVTADTLGEPGLTIERGRDQQRASGDVMVPAASWTLTNAAGTYNPQRGPLSSSLLPGRPAQITASLGDTAITLDEADVTLEDGGVFMEGSASFSLLAGALDDLTITPDLGNRTLQLRALGKLLNVRGRLVSTPLYANITTGTAMTYLLQAAGLSAADYVIDSDAIAYGRALTWWWVDQQDAYDAAVQLLETEGPPAALYEDGAGRVVFESRLYRSSKSRSTTAQGTFRDEAVAGGLYYETIAYEPGLRDIVNEVSLALDVRTVGAQTDVWTYGATATLNASGAASVLAQPNEPFTDAVVPVVTTDFTLSTGTVTVALSRTSGGSTLISFSAGTPSATVTGLKLRAKSVPVTSTVVLTNASSSATTGSQAAFGVRSQAPDVVRTLSLTEGQLLANAITDYYAASRPTATITFANADNAHAVQTLIREVSDRIRLVNSALGVDDDYTIEQLTHEVKTAGLHTVRLGLEQAPPVIGLGRWLADGSASGTSDWSNDAGTTPNKGIWG